MSWNKKKIGRIFVLAGLVYLSGGLLIFLIQDRILFHPKPLLFSHKFDFGQQLIEHNIPEEGGKNLNVLQFTAKEKKGTILFFHGNMDNVEHYKKYIPYFTSMGYEVWMMDYPGFGKSTGERTEEAIYKDAQTVYRLARKESSTDSLIIYGKSIGTGVAAQLASVEDCSKLILETPYYNIEALAKHFIPFYPIKLLSTYRFPTNLYLPKVKAPVTILHGTEDEIIPYEQAAQLKAENKSIQLCKIINGKHNDLLSYPQFRNDVSHFLLH
ncbi:MAG: alpha/beta fold hydrolase [Chitinophagaceae bacterium]